VIRGRKMASNEMWWRKLDKREGRKKYTSLRPSARSSKQRNARITLTARMASTVRMACDSVVETPLSYGVSEGNNATGDSQGRGGEGEAHEMLTS
jgi:hypothetical protein